MIKKKSPGGNHGILPSSARKLLTKYCWTEYEISSLVKQGRIVLTNLNFNDLVIGVRMAMRLCFL